jgi:CRISPR-associated endonuclease Csn1
VDETFEFLFSLHPNDLVRLSQRNKSPIVGYYSSTHRGTGNVNLWVHDRNRTTGKDGLIEGLGVKTANGLEKFNVDVLGNAYLAERELRRGLA